MILMICCLIGVGCSFVCFFFNEELLLLFFNNTAGAQQLKLCAIPFMVYALQPVLSSLLHAQDLSKQAFIDTFAGCLLRIMVLFFTDIFQEYTLIIALCSGMLCTTFMHAWRVYVSLKALKPIF